MKSFVKAAVVGAALMFAVPSMAEVSVIVNSSAATSPSMDQVANIFLARDKSLVPVDLESWNGTKDTFYSTVVKRNEGQLRSYWSGLIFTGKAQPPTSLGSDAEVVSHVSSNANAIGYVDSASVTPGVKVLFTLP